MGAWDRMHRDYEASHPDAPVQTVIQRETPIIPTVVAFAVCEEAGLCLGLPLPVEWIAELAEHAEVVYQHGEDRLLPADGAVETMRRGGRQRVRYAQLA